MNYSSALFVLLDKKIKDTKTNDNKIGNKTISQENHSAPPLHMIFNTQVQKATYNTFTIKITEVFGTMHV